MGKTTFVMTGGTGAVGSEVIKSLLEHDDVSLTLLGRRTKLDLPESVTQHVVDLFDPTSYEHLVDGHDIAICTLGVGEPSKMSKEEFVRIDKTMVLDFAKVCRESGVRHFQLLSSVGTGSDSSMFYLRTKGELEDAIADLRFKRFSVFHPSMILTPENRYGFSQAVTLKTWPLLSHAMVGGLKKFRGIKVEDLGRAFSVNAFKSGAGVEHLYWSDFKTLLT